MGDSGKNIIDFEFKALNNYYYFKFKALNNFYFLNSKHRIKIFFQIQKCNNKKI